MNLVTNQTPRTPRGRRGVAALTLTLLGVGLGLLGGPEAALTASAVPAAAQTTVPHDAVALALPNKVCVGCW